MRRSIDTRILVLGLVIGAALLARPIDLARASADLSRAGVDASRYQVETTGSIRPTAPAIR
jgi:hypothetical protein